MKKNFFRIALIVMVGGLMMASSGCKKGENDPSISLRSRTARLAGEWNLSAEDYKESSISDNSSTTETVTYDGSILTTVTVRKYKDWTGKDTTVTNTETDSYTEKLTINKDGSFTREIIYGSTRTNYEGNWMWMKGNSEQELKNKQAIILSTTKYTYVDGDGNTSYHNESGKSNFSNMIVIDRLANKEMVFLYDTKYSDDDGFSSTESGTATYTQK
jgi:hypothetical protein